MTTLKMNKVDTLPEIARAGRKSEELNMIIAALNESAKDGNSVRIDGIKAGNAYNSMQQRIRAQARKLNLNVEIHYDKKNETLYFRVPNVSEFETAIAPKGEVVKSKDIKNVKTVVRKK